MSNDAQHVALMTGESAAARESRNARLRSQLGKPEKLQRIEDLAKTLGVHPFDALWIKRGDPGPDATTFQRHLYQNAMQKMRAAQERAA